VRLPRVHPRIAGLRAELSESGGCSNENDRGQDMSFDLQPLFDDNSTPDAV
jgi:hypothetical protein